MVSLNPINVLSKVPQLQTAVKWASKDGGRNLDKLQKHLPAIEGMWISLFYVLNTMSSKKIPDERKTPLAINSLFSGIFGAAGGYVLTDRVFKLSKIMQERAEIIYKADPAKLATIQKGLKAVVPLFAFTFVFRYLSPVIATPIADKINKFLIKHKIIKDPANTSSKEDKGKQVANNDQQKSEETINSFLNKTGFDVKI